MTRKTMKPTVQARSYPRYLKIFAAYIVDFVLIINFQHASRTGWSNAVEEKVCLLAYRQQKINNVHNAEDDVGDIIKAIDVSRP